MENKITLGGSLKKMTENIKKSKGLFWSIIILILIPVLIINCYSFYSAYNGTVIDYSKMEQINFQNEILSGNFDGLFKAFDSVITFPDYDETFTDIAFEVINFIVSAFFDAVMIVLAVQLLFDRKFKTGDLVKASVKRIFPAIIFGLFTTWILTEVQSLIFSSVEYIAIFAHLAASGSIESLIMLSSAIISSVVQFFIAILISSMGIMLISYMTVPVISGRCRGILIAPQYAFEVLRKNIWRQTFHVMPLVTAGFIVPLVLQIIGVFISSNMPAALIIVGISIVIQCVFNGLLWMLIVPDFFALEEKSGIQAKIKEMMEKAMRDFENARKSRQQENSENSEVADDTEKKDETEEKQDK